MVRAWFRFRYREIWAVKVVSWFLIWADSHSRFDSALTASASASLPPHPPPPPRCCFPNCIWTLACSHRHHYSHSPQLLVLPRACRLRVLVLLRQPMPPLLPGRSISRPMPDMTSSSARSRTSSSPSSPSRSFHVRAKLLDAVNGTKYEDKDGDWMLVVDVPGSQVLCEDQSTNTSTFVIHRVQIYHLKVKILVKVLQSCEVLVIMCLISSSEKTLDATLVSSRQGGLVDLQGLQASYSF
ncbi:hypothetical protein GQ55_1G098400 [Panicum hallii var. hallii]|uniref:Auxin-responsive protein n=1 Tax=Panicum hallii var. hallii TaxID=1504633 RepID=A0A2T7F457_9POAL|nr:hypothetical protein GQ55_1G098400 [Panicum hallii var. hallii]